MRVAILTLFLLGAWAPHLPAQTPYYQGKQIKVIVGFTTGGFYDRWARLLSRYMPKHIPGNPEMIVQNMPGAGSVIAANYVYSVAKADGLTIGFPSNAIYLDQLIGRGEVKYDVRKFAWIGSPVTEPMIFYVRSDSPFKTIQDIKNAKDPAKCGSTGTVSSDYILARLLEETLPPTKINTVLGYPGGAEIDLAVERGEVSCRGMTVSPFFGREPFLSWQKKTSSVCCSSPAASATNGFPMCRHSMRSLTEKRSPKSSTSCSLRRVRRSRKRRATRCSISPRSTRSCSSRQKGKGVLFDNASKKPTYMLSNRARTGPGVGRQRVYQIFVFKSKGAMDQFILAGGTGGDVSASVSSGQDGSVRFFNPSIDIYQIPESGMALQASWGGTVYSVDTQLK